MILTPPPLSLYVHLPWCLRKCPYCDFNSHTAGAAADKRRYLAALGRDLAAESRRAQGRRVVTIFLGGGTPSYFTAAEIGQLLQTARAALNVADDAEITMEANPGTVERDALAAYRRAGVSRLSIGAQSFNDTSLRRLGRIHGSAEIHGAARDARKAGFDSINLDLMFALPGQSLDLALADLRQAVELAPEHLSWYQLTLEPNTVFHARPPADLPDEDLCWEIEQGGRELLQAAGYRHYETSAFALPGFRCRHNLNYWQFGDYLAVGAGAHGKFTDANGDVWRYIKPAHPLSYMHKARLGLPDPAPHKLGRAELVFEYMLNALRLEDGFAQRDFEARTGLSWSSAEPRVSEARQMGLMAPSAGGCWAPTEQGRRFLNDLQGLFLPELYSQLNA